MGRLCFVLLILFPGYCWAQVGITSYPYSSTLIGIGVKYDQTSSWGGEYRMNFSYYSGNDYNFRIDPSLLLFYRFRKQKRLKPYTGVGVGTRYHFYKRDKERRGQFKFVNFFVPIGIEAFPFREIPSLGLILESHFNIKFERSGDFTSQFLPTVGVVYYLQQKN